MLESSWRKGGNYACYNTRWLQSRFIIQMESLIDMAKVYISQEILKKTIDNERVPAYDFTPALQYGELRVVVPYGVYSDSKNIGDVIAESLKDFRDDDYLLAIGDPTIVAMSAIIASERNGGKLNLLKWDRARRAYRPVHIDVLSSMWGQ